MLCFGIDVGGTAIKCGLFDGEEPLGRLVVPYGELKSPRELADCLVRAMREIMEPLWRDFCDIDAIGIAMPGTVDSSRGIVHSAHNIRIEEAPLAELVSDATRRPCAIINDADAAALAELEFGALRGTQTSIVITLGTGVGSGLILDGKLFLGGRRRGVELGHMVFDYDSEHVCACKNRGCNDIMCSSTSILNAAKLSVQSGRPSAFAREVAEGKRRLSARLVVDCAREGDEEAAAIFGEYVDRVAAMLASVIALLDPEVIAVGGGISQVGDFFFKPLITNVRKRCIYGETADIVPASLMNDAGMLGAAMFARMNGKPA